MVELMAALRQAFKDAVKNWVFIPLIILIDLIFLFVFGFVYSLYFDKILFHMTSIMQAMPDASSLLQQGTGSLSSVYGINASISSIYSLGILLAISTFVIWAVFQFAAWLIAHKISGSKVKFMEFLKSFAVVSTIWFVIFSIIMYFSISATLANAFASQAPSEDFWSLYGLLIASAVLGYFVIVSYSLTGKIRDVLRKTMIYCFTKPKVLLAYVLLLILLVVINFIIFGLWYLNQTLSIVIGAVLVLLYFVFARIYMIELIKILEKKK